MVWAYGLGVPGTPVEVDGFRVTPVLNPPTVRFYFGPAEAPITPGGAGTTPASTAAFPPTPLYQVNITLPELPQGLRIPACDGTSVKSNVTILISGLSSMDAVRLCVVP